MFKTLKNAENIKIKFSAPSAATKQQPGGLVKRQKYFKRLI